MTSIGGYFELELNQGQELYPKAIRLNSARNCLEYIILANNYKKIFLPYYICDVILFSLKKINIEYEFYNINENFIPTGEIVVEEDEAFLYVNYFGLKDEIIQKLNKTIKNLIIDNSQAFFSKPLELIDTYYSPRKFFGVSDGGYVFCNKQLNKKLREDKSLNRANYLLSRIDENAEVGYKLFLENEKKLCGQPIKKMSKLTKRILQSINYEKVMKTRNENFCYLHEYLNRQNQLLLSTNNLHGPLVYPLYIKIDGLRDFLIQNRIYVATYWQNVIDTCANNSIEYNFAKYIIPLPIDQRYCLKDMKKIIGLILEFTKNHVELS